MWFVIIAVILFFIISIFSGPSKKKLEARKQALARRQEEKKKKEEAWKNELLIREAEYGSLTRIIKVYTEEESICVYQKTETIFILKQKLSFSDLLSCSIESDLIKGKEKHITKPDKYELAEKQLLYGMGKNYNVKQITTIEKEPDITNYRIFITLKDISVKPIVIRLTDESIRANEIYSLINAIIVNQNERRERTILIDE